MPEAAELSRLRAALEGALAPLEGVEPKRLFGCDGYFVGGNIFALVWKEGRLGIRLEDPGSLAEAHALPGSASWEIGSKRMRQWVLLPEDLHSRPSELRRWGRRAWEQARARPERPRVSGRGGMPPSVRPAVFRILKRKGLDA